MIKKLTFIAVIIIISATLISGITNGNQAPYGHTGSLGDGKNCSFCHTGTPQTDSNITTNIPISGYVPGSTYTITINTTKAGINKFGFQLTAENSTGGKEGTFVITNATETKLIQDEVTHTGLGTAASNNQKTWNINWTAPAAGTGNVIFYSAVNATNANSSPTGDMIYLSNTTVSEDLSSSIGKDNLSQIISIKPTISSDYIYVNSTNLIQEILIFDINGKIVFSTENVNSNNQRIDVSSFNSGIYYVKTKTNKEIKTIKILKN